MEIVRDVVFGRHSVLQKQGSFASKISGKGKIATSNKTKNKGVFERFWSICQK